MAHRDRLLGRRSALIVYAHLGYPLLLGLLSRLFGEPRARARTSRAGRPGRAVALIVAAYDEEEVIERKVANALALDYPREPLEVVVASDGSATAPSSWRGRPAPTWCSTCPGAARSRR